jgi:hypothetical protein
VAQQRAAETVVEVRSVGHRPAVVAVSEQGEFLSQVHHRDGSRAGP